MIAGQSKTEFPLKIDAAAIAEITQMSESGLEIDAVDMLLNASAPLEDIHTATVLDALQRYMKSRHVDPGFEVVVE